MKIVEELNTFKATIKSMLKLYKMMEPLVCSRIISSREPAIECVDFLNPKIRDFAMFYIRRFCKHKTIQSDTIYKVVLREIVTLIRDHIYFPLPKEYAKFIGVKMDKKKKGEIEYA